ncbi:MAG: site-specific DNA-methyltransferase [Flavonifractor plautii]
MPTLEWIGKSKVINHHQDVPFRVLERKYSFDKNGQHDEDNGSENMIIRGDNLEALKALLPRYEGRVKCIYIDPPYNTGNEGWVYNDNVNDPKIKKWLGEVVGKEGEDLTRHDKWLCMMYPRLKLLQKLLADDGVIFISIDEIEHRYLELVMDEIFGSANRIDTFVWQNNYGGGAKSNYVVHLHEYVLCFAKNISTVGKIELPPDDNILKYYKYKDEKFDARGPYRLQPLATTSMDDRPNLRYPLFYEGHEVWPAKQWFWSKERALEAQANDELVFSEKNGKWTVNYKQYLNGADGTQRKSKPYSIITGIYTQAGTKAIKEIMGSGKAFDFPKPPELIMYFIQMITGEDDTVLDSFAGSGTTAHAVLNMNKSDGGHRKFILVEMMDYADSITAERVKRVIRGYGEGKNAVEGTGGNFSFYDLGEPLLVGDCLNEAVAPEKIREYIWFMETKQPYAPPCGGNPYYLGKHNSTGYYFYYEPQRVTVLDYTFLSTITEKADGTVIYADRCSISEDKLAKMGVTFKKIPRDISRL